MMIHPICDVLQLADAVELDENLVAFLEARLRLLVNPWLACVVLAFSHSFFLGCMHALRCTK